MGMSYSDNLDDFKKRSQENGLLGGSRITFDVVIGIYVTSAFVFSLITWAISSFSVLGFFEPISGWSSIIFFMFTVAYWIIVTFRVLREGKLKMALENGSNTFEDYDQMLYIGQLIVGITSAIMSIIFIIFFIINATSPAGWLSYPTGVIVLMWIMHTMNAIAMFVIMIRSLMIVIGVKVMTRDSRDKNLFFGGHIQIKKNTTYK